MAGSTTSSAAVCFTCGESAGMADSFCEACGTELTPLTVSDGTSSGPAACESCSSSRVSADGYCESCGGKVRSGRDHEEADLRMVAGVTDRGRRHHRNEDAMALAVTGTQTGPAVVAVVCDGVSSSAHPDEASLAAVRAAARVLLTAVRIGDDLRVASFEAVTAATEAVATVPAGEPGDPPSATYVSAVLTAGAATICWLGDSRAYWLATGPGPARQLTQDDSIAGEMVARGLLSEAEALASAQAHVVTQWIGADISDPAPHVIRFEPPSPGALLLCSDGLWNYQPAAAKLAEMALPGALTDPLGTAQAMVTFALDAGGMDNVTAVLAPFPLPGPPTVPTGQP